MSSQVIPQEKRMSPELMYPSDHDKAVRKRRNIVAALVALTLLALIGVIVAVVVVTSDDSTSGDASSSEQQASGGGSATTTTTRRTTRTTTTAARVTTTTTAAAVAESEKQEEAPALPSDCSSVKTSVTGKPCLLPYSIEFPPPISGVFPGIVMESSCDSLANIVPPQAANAKAMLFAGFSDDEYICAVDEQLRTVPILGETSLPVFEKCAAPCNA